MSGKYLTPAIKTTLIAVFTFQLLSTVERQVFDFLGYMWAPIIGNFFQIIAVILGLFGACQHYRSFVIVYTVWSLLWLGWNIFVICLYLEVGILNRNRERYILTIGTEGKSWWLEHGIGCIITNNSWLLTPATSDSGRPIPPEEFVKGCILQYYYVEVIHAAVQCLLSLVGFVVACVTIYTYLEEEYACKYLVTTRTYARPQFQTGTLPLSRCGIVESVGTYRPVATRDSWCLPTYVSYHDSQEWSVSHRDLHHHLNSPSPSQSVGSHGAFTGHDRLGHNPDAETNSSCTHWSTQPYHRLSMISNEHAQVLEP